MSPVRPRTIRPRRTGVAVALATGVLIGGAAVAPSAQAATTPGAVVSFTFDDGRTSQYNNARPVLEAAGFRGTFYIISDAMTWGRTYMTADQVRALGRAGHEVGNHTRDHANLSRLSTSEVRAEFKDSQSRIAAATGYTPRSCAYPHGASNSTVESVAATFFRSCRTTESGTNTTSTNRYRLRTLYVHTSASPDDVKAAVAEAKRDKVWLILCYHGVGEADSSDDVSRETLAGHVKAVKASGVPVRTVGKVAG